MQLVCVVVQLALHASSVHFATQLVCSVSQATTQVSPSLPCWFTVGFSTFAVHPNAARRHDAATNLANESVMDRTPWLRRVATLDVPIRHCGARAWFKAPGVPTYGLCSP